MSQPQTVHSTPPRHYRSVSVRADHAQVWVLVEELDGRLKVRRVGDPPDRTCILPAEWLVPVPPSVEDPQPLPVQIVAGNRSLVIDRDTTVRLRVVLHQSELLHTGEGYVHAVISLDDAALTRIAQAAWQARGGE